MVLHKAPIPAAKVMRRGKGEDALDKEAKAQSQAEASEDFNAKGEKGIKAKTLTIANPMNMVNKVTGSAKGNVAAPLYFPGAKSSALRNHAGVKFLVYRVDSPEDLTDPITIMFKLDLANKVLRTSNPAAPSQRMSRKYYHLRSLDIDLWEHDGQVGVSLVERQTSCFCFHSGIERDYVFSNETERSHFVSLIHSIDDQVLPENAIPPLETISPRVDQTPVRLFVSTWNQGDTAPSTNLANDWLPTDGSIDIFVIGTQESPLGADSTGMTSGASSKWFKTLLDAVGDDYVPVATRSMFQNHLWVATKKEHAAKFSAVETYQAEQGIAGVWGNKGGTAVALRFNGYKLCFVNTHLAAHAEKWEKRNEDIMNVTAALQFGNYSQVEFVNQYTTFWLGDLNYRVEMDRQEATALVEKGDLATLIENEQLKREMQKGILDGFIEGDLTFRPTYKFDPRTPSAPKVRTPRPYSDHKDRTPSWTDRVLMRPMPGHTITQVAYDSAWKVTSSDHDPVFGIYDFVAPEIPKTGNYRRFLLIISGLEISDLTSPGADMTLTINFPFLDDIKKGIKFKHSIPVKPKPGVDGVFLNPGTFKLGPFITTAEFFRRRHITLRVKDKSERHGTTSVSLKDAIDNDVNHDFEVPITRRTYRRGTLRGTVIIKVAGGQEAGIVPDDDSTDYEQMLAKGEIDADANSEDEDVQEPAPAPASAPEPEPEPAFGEGIDDMLAEVTK